MADGKGTKVYKCSNYENCGEWINGDIAGYSLCWICFKQAVQQGQIEPVMPYPLNWGEINLK